MKLLTKRQSKSLLLKIYFYKETKTGNGYSRILDRIAPVAQVGEHLTYTQKDVDGIKKSCEKAYDRKVQATAGTQPNSVSQDGDFGMPL